MGAVTREDKTVNGQAFYTAYTYNLAGQVLTQRLPNGKVVTNTYDSLNRGPVQVFTRFPAGLQPDAFNIGNVRVLLSDRRTNPRFAARLARNQRTAQASLQVLKK
jgi:YD repeat-containing protein